MRFGAKRDDRKKMKKKLRPTGKRRPCRFCADKKMTIDYKNAKLLSPFLSERGRLVPSRITGNCRRHQRQVTTAIKRARIMAISSFTATQLRQV